MRTSHSLADLCGCERVFLLFELPDQHPPQSGDSQRAHIAYDRVGHGYVDEQWRLRVLAYSRGFL